MYTGTVLCFLGVCLTIGAYRTIGRCRVCTSVAVTMLLAMVLFVASLAVFGTTMTTWYSCGEGLAGSFASSFYLVCAAAGICALVHVVLAFCFQRGKVLPMTAVPEQINPASVFPATAPPRQLKNTKVEPLCLQRWPSPLLSVMRWRPCKQRRMDQRLTTSGSTMRRVTCTGRASSSSISTRTSTSTSTLRANSGTTRTQMSGTRPKKKRIYTSLLKEFCCKQYFTCSVCDD